MQQDKKKPIKKAAALKYDMGDSAPRVVAKGKGKVAEKILEKAAENDVPIHNDPELAHMLNLLELGEQIPQELYDVVARILIFVAEMDRLKGEY